MGIKVLFIYPNTYGMNMLPPAIAGFSALLKKHGHEISIFDTTYYAIDYGIDADGTKMERLNVVPYDMGEKGIRLKTSDWKEDWIKLLNDFKPDLIGISSTEDMWELGVLVLEEGREYIKKNNVKVIAGGVFPTFAPEICSQHELVDMICVGEGEHALTDLCSKIENKEDYTDVTNLWVKHNGKVIKKNKMSKPVDVNTLPMIDVDMFEEARLYRPMAGKVYKMFPVETIRGCPYTCRFCNSPDQMNMYKNVVGGGYFRKKNLDLVHKELKYMKENKGVEYNYFWADTFLAMNRKEFDQFCEMYEDIRLPFWMQTRPETVTDYNMKKLKSVGLHRISFGIEHGNEKFRREILDRRWSNKDIIDKLKIPKKYDISFSCNNITGFPKETKKLAMDTVELNRVIDATNASISTFMPFHGTPLRKLCESMDLISEDKITKCITGETILNMPQYPPHEIEEIKKCFTMYIKFPRNRWKEIERAEKNDTEGNKIYLELKKEYLEKYMPTADADPHGGLDAWEELDENDVCGPATTTRTTGTASNNVPKKTN
jgi:anaerobic magnesium-protoporphyrin IX monomethyl ester cyclase